MNLDDLWDFGDPAASEKRFREALAAGSFDEAQTKTQLARSLTLQKRFEEAQVVLDEVSRSLPQGDSVARARLLLEQGRVFRSSGNPEKGLPLFHEAAELSARLGEGGFEIDALHMVALADDPAKSEHWNRVAIERAEASNDPRARKWLGSLNNNLGWSLFDRGALVEALEAFNKALQARHEQGNPEQIRIAEWCVARILRELGRNEEAFAIHLRHFEQDPDSTYGNEELALLYEIKGENSKAKDHAARALNAMEADPYDEFPPERQAKLASLAAG
ncbi:MAG: hypothetical protein JSS72_11505 [Armatimonadetes bacterium]|nr:hypothetical protein [Armatimonadota bacterium]